MNGGNLLKPRAELAQKILQILLTQGKMAYALIDKDLIIQETSPNFQHFFHLSHPAEGKTINEICEALMGAEQVLRDVQQDKLPEYRLEYVNYENDNSLMYITLNLWKNPDKSEGPGLILVVEDVTSAGHLEQRAVQNRNELQLLRTELNRANTELQQLALFDSLTSLPNRRYLDDELQRYAEYAQQQGTPLAIIMLDIDEFKSLNDTYGHPEGDQCLRILAAAIRDSTRITDFAARYAGDEFCVFLPLANASQALALARRIQSNLAEKLSHTSLKFTISLGIMSVSGQSKFYTPELLIRKADQALYQAKKEGKNRIYTYQEP
jgi:diguanylate cyclase (GGDEF)-like protein